MTLYRIIGFGEHAERGPGVYLYLYRTLVHHRGHQHQHTCKSPWSAFDVVRRNKHRPQSAIQACVILTVRTPLFVRPFWAYITLKLHITCSSAPWRKLCFVVSENKRTPWGVIIVLKFSHGRNILFHTYGKSFFIYDVYEMYIYTKPFL